MADAPKMRRLTVRLTVEVLDTLDAYAVVEVPDDEKAEATAAEKARALAKAGKLTWECCDEGKIDHDKVEVDEVEAAPADLDLTVAAGEGG